MAWFWFLVCIGLVIILATKKNSASSSDEEYGRGYWDGYRALGDKVQDELDSDTIDRHALQIAVNRGHGDNTPASVESRSQSLETTKVDESEFGDGTTLAGYDDLQLTSTYSSDEQIRQALAADVRAIDSGAIALRNEKKSLENLNTILYMASFLLVAAASAFVATAMPGNIRLIGLIVIVVLFYGAGWILYKSVARLRPAATAFLGTGLAILPFVGVALNLLGGVPETTAWLIISAIGLVAYVAAAVLLQSQVISYLTMAFVLSLASSAVASASLPMVWYFIVLIGISLTANSLSILRPTLVPEIFRRPIESTGQFVTPLALLASLVVPRMTIDVYEVVFGVATAHYLVVWLQQKTMMYESVVRGLAYATLLILAWDVADNNVTQFGIWWLVIAVLQAAYSLVRVQAKNASSKAAENGWLITASALILFGIVFWSTAEHAAYWTATSLLVVGVISTVSLLRLRDITWGYIGLGISIVLPFTIARLVIEPALPWSALVGCFIVLGSSALVAYHYMKNRMSASTGMLFMTALLTYIGLAVMSGLISQDAVVLGWSLLFASALLIGLSYSGGYVWSEIIAAVLFVPTVALWLGESSLESRWLLTGTVLISSGLLVAASIAHHLRGEVERRNALVSIGMIVVAGLVGNLGQLDGGVAQTSLLILVTSTLLSYGLRMATRRKSATLQSIFTFGYFGYILLAWISSLPLSGGWHVLVYGLAALVFWLGSYAEKLPALTLIGNVALVVMTAVLWYWLEFDSDWAVFGISWIAAAVLYGAYWLMVERHDVWRQWVCLGSVWVILAYAVLVQFFNFDDVQRIAAAATLIAAAATLGIHGYLFEKRNFVESSIYIATFGLQRLVGLVIPEADMVFYAHWWAIVLGLVAWWRGMGHRAARLAIGMSLISTSTAAMALTGNGMYQLLFLVEHLVLLVIGAIIQKSWATWWGIIAAVLAILYFLREYTFLWLGFLGLFLIGIVVWRLMRNSGASTQ